MAEFPMVVHYSVQVEEGERVACNMGVSDLHHAPHHPMYQRSNEVRAVTCLVCKKSNEYKTALMVLEAALRARR